MFLQASVILSTGGEYLTRYPPGLGTTADQVHLPPGPGTPPQTRYTPGTRYPPDQVHPPAQSMLGDTVNARAVRILLECILVVYVFVLFFTACKRSCGMVIFLQVSVCPQRDGYVGGGVVMSLRRLIYLGDGYIRRCVCLGRWDLKRGVGSPPPMWK